MAGGIRARHAWQEKNLSVSRGRLSVSGLALFPGSLCDHRRFMLFENSVPRMLGKSRDASEAECDLMNDGVFP